MIAAARRLARQCVTALAFAASSALAQNREFDLQTASIADIQSAVAAGSLTYAQLVRLYLNRIEAYDKRGPRLNAIIQVNQRAIAIADSLDAERRTKGLRSPLHGIPVAIKDNIDVRDLPSAGGNLALGGSYPARDAAVIARLRAAGAIIFVKTNMDELALGSQGLSSLGGQILNPFDLQRSPGGSSGGSAVAVAVAFATVAVSTETGLSIRGPAANTATVGIAPTQGLVSRAGVIPISFTQDRVGVHAKSVRDAATLLAYISGFDPEDLVTADAFGKVSSTAFSDFATGDLVGARIGVLRDLFRHGDEFVPGNRLVENAIDRMRTGRAIIEDGLTTGIDLVALMPDLRVNNYELRFAFDAYLRRRGSESPVKSLAELIATGKYLRTLDRRYELVMSVAGLDTNSEYLGRLERQRTIRQALIDLMDRKQVDALVYPVKSLPAPPIGTADSGPRDNPVSAVTGLPAIVMPAGFGVDGLPIAIEFLGRPFREAKLIQLAYAYERSLPRRSVPPTAPRLPGEVIRY